MNRRKFITNSVIVSGGFTLAPILHKNYINNHYDGFPVARSLPDSYREPVSNLYELFKDPPLSYHPYVRWWWNGNKVEAGELIRELRLLKEAGIGGIEINPVEFPSRSEGDDLGKPSVRWLSDEWIDLLKLVFDEAKNLGMTCDLIVGSGWPFGSESLEDNERSQVVTVAVKKLTGPADYEISEYEIFREADPAISSPFTGRTMELMSLLLIPDPLEKIEQITDLKPEAGKKSYRISVHAGKHAVIGLVKINGFMQVINGVPGATGPVLDHYNSQAIRKYLDHMSVTIEARIGPLSGYIRALFTDSLELEGANWTGRMQEYFIEKNGYDLLPWLPFILFKTGGMGNVTDFNYNVKLSPDLENIIRRVRYDFDFTKAALLNETLTKTYLEWCSRLNVKSRAQAYGRGLFPLESSFDYDIPEGESWTMNWLKHRIGEEMPEEDYRRGRAYTMVNKYVSSAAHLKGKKLVSCEEMTDTYTVFNTSLENLKIGSDQSIISGITHSIFHGFNYSPPEAPYPGWIRYGAYYNEQNTWWPWFRIFNEYKGRLSSLLQNVMMFADIAILPPLDDMWSLIGAPMEPFPSVTHVDYFTLVWEAINKNGNGCDYVSQAVIRDSEMKEGFMHYGPRKYNTLFLVKVDSLKPETASKMMDFINAGGRIFCVESLPSKSPGFSKWQENDRMVNELIEKMKAVPDRFILLEKPEKDFIGWFRSVQEKYNIRPYVEIEKPDPFVMQSRYQAEDGTEVIYVINSHLNNSFKSKLAFSDEVSSRKTCWKWDPETGRRYRIKLDKGSSFDIDLGPAESFLFVFDRTGKGEEWKPVPSQGNEIKTFTEGWMAEFTHCHDGSVKNIYLDKLKDLKDHPDYMNFAGTVKYRHSFTSYNISARTFLNAGKVYGLCTIKINGKEIGVKWYGRRIFELTGYLKPGRNDIEILVATSMGNYMKSLTDNPIAQYWTNEKNKVQPLQSMGLIGPITIYQPS